MKSAHRQLVEQFFDQFCAGNVDEVMSMVTDDIDWQMMGQHGGLPVSGHMDKQGIQGLMQTVADATYGLSVTYNGWTIEGNRVALEMESNADLKNGRHYHNLYHYLIIVEGQKLKQIKEYADTDEVRRVFLDP
ncbi:nuclear transport factor 2 family protein [Endozoicomonas ascidiicola]|uniref:nuclear transport factor 2 family protein n=1 Tax=Endozoicomonas ascidiicola TaxID=1698521 RepID=UPI000836F471|nr:nuclear transport factor 2 family protein [Endozoicomonas ascidiicola]